jgi:hypothetical protein
VVTKPAELVEAEIVLGLCRMLHKMPSQIRAEDMELLRLLAIEQAGGSAPDQGGEADDGWK